MKSASSLEKTRRPNPSRRKLPRECERSEERGDERGEYFRVAREELDEDFAARALAIKPFALAFFIAAVKRGSEELNTGSASAASVFGEGRLSAVSRRMKASADADGRFTTS
jgi:hypothetical protein